MPGRPAKIGREASISPKWGMRENPNLPSYSVRQVVPVPERRNTHADAVRRDVGAPDSVLETGWERVVQMRQIVRMMLSVAVVTVGSSIAQTALACPDYTLTGEQATYSSNELYSPVRHTLTAGGDYDLAQCQDIPGTGWVTREPDYTFRLTGNAAQRRKLVFRTEAGCDTVLLVNAPSGSWAFDDDGSQGLNAKIDFQNAADGLYDIWVGTSGTNDCRATLITETFGNAGKRSR